MATDEFDDLGDEMSRLGKRLLADRDEYVDQILSGELPTYDAYLASCQRVAQIDDTIKMIGLIRRGVDLKRPPKRQSVNVEEC